jgi:hypothetical protein
VQRPQGQEIGIAGAGADQKHGLGLAAAAVAAGAVLVDRGHKLRLRLRGMAGEDGLGDRTSDDALPEAARRHRARNRGKAAAMASDQGGEFADARGQQGFDQLAQAPRQCRRSSTGPDCDHHLAAIDDGGKDEGRQLRAVDDVDGDAPGPRALGDLRVDRISRRRYDRRDVAHVGAERIADADFQTAPSGQRQELFRNVGVAREPAHVRSGGAQQTQLAERRLARADKDEDACGGI